MSKLTLDAKVVLAAIPVAAYVMCYRYEAGFLAYFMVPPDFIAVDYRSLIAVAGSIAVAVLIFFGYLNTIIAIASRWWHYWLGRFACVVLCAIAVSWAVGWFVPFSYDGSVQTVIIGVGIAAGTILAIRRPKPRRPETEHAPAGTPNARRTDLVALVAKVVEPWVVLCVIGLVLATVAAEIVGSAQASKQRQFILLRSVGGSKDRAVVRCYSSRAIIADIDLKRRTIDRSFSVVPVESLANDKLVVLETGPFSVGTLAPPASQPTTNSADKP